MNNDESYQTLTMWFTAGFIAVAFVVVIVAFIYKLFI